MSWHISSLIGIHVMLHVTAIYVLDYLLFWTLPSISMLILMQSQFPDVNDEDLKAMDVEISELNAQLKELQDSNKKMDCGITYHIMHLLQKVDYFQKAYCRINYVFSNMYQCSFMNSLELRNLESSLTTEDAKKQLEMLEKQVRQHV